MLMLISHNGRRFDFPVLLKMVINTDKTGEFFDNVCVDWLTLYQYSKRAIMVGKVINRKNEYIHFLTQLLMPIMQSVMHRPWESQLKHGSFTQRFCNTVLLHVLSKMHCCLGRKKQKICLYWIFLLVKVYWKCAQHVAGSGLQLTHLKNIFQRDGEDGLVNTFISPNSEGQLRVTNVRRTLECVILNFFGERWIIF